MTRVAVGSQPRRIGIIGTCLLAGLLAPSLSLPATADGLSPSLDELTEAQRWVAAKLLGTAEFKLPGTGLVVLANYDPVQKNAWCGKPLTIGRTEYYRGLFCHAPSKVLVRLPGPGKTFQALAGVDSNIQTFPGRGSIICSVTVGEKVVFRTDVMREGMPAVPAIVDLGGASEFLLEVSDAGDGIGCDQGVWAEARVALNDGRTLWLGEQPVIQGASGVPWTTEPPFAFTYDGKPSAELLGSWRLERSQRKLDELRTEYVLRWTDPQTGLVVRCVAAEYHDFPSVEWTVHFTNTGSNDAAILEDIQALDMVCQRYPPAPVEPDKLGEFALHHHEGDYCSPRSYQPHRSVLGPKAELRFAPRAGRPCDPVLPYFNLEWLSEGIIVAVGWPGQWSAKFARDEKLGLRIRAGQELTRLKLHSGEEVRTPLVVLQFWKGDRVRSQNIWRRWMRAHNMPRPGGKPLDAQTAAGSGIWTGEMVQTNEENQKWWIARFLAEGVRPDYWWMDAGWYVGAAERGWPFTGTWEVDRERYRRGLKAISDYAHQREIKTIVWFEPERVVGGTWLAENHPEWVFGGRSGGLLDLGHSQARQWLTDHVHGLLTQEGIDIYRNDFNIDPLPFWRGADAPDRQGMAENRYVTGYLAYWDELLRRTPNLLIDSCASGGRRNDLETLRRAVPLLRSDVHFDALAMQGHTYGLAFWLPFYGTSVRDSDAYVFRSSICPHNTSSYDVRDPKLDHEPLRKRYAERQIVAPFLLHGDYYPLTPYSLDESHWIGWQFHRPETGTGIVQMFRRPESVYESARVRLRGLDSESMYRLTNLDAPNAPQVIAGRELMQRGLHLAIEDRPGAVVITYRVDRLPASKHSLTGMRL